MLYILYCRVKIILTALLPLFIAISAIGTVVLLIFTFFGFKAHRRMRKNQVIKQKSNFENTENPSQEKVVL